MKISLIEKKPSPNEFYQVAFADADTDGECVFDCAQKVVTIKLPAKNKLNWRQTVLIPRKIISTVKKNHLKKFSIDWSLIKGLELGEEEAVAEAFAINLEMANYEFVKFKTAPKSGWNFVEEVQIITQNKTAIAKAIKKGQIIGQEINACRELSNMPGGLMTPEIMVAETKKAVVGTNIKLSVLDEEKMQKLGMGAILAVGKGSKEKSQFLIMEYAGATTKNPVVLIGKGVTFDSGGLNLKSGDGMSSMNMDMSGGSAVIHAVIAAAKLGIKKRVICLVPIVESMPSGESLRPGDIITSMSGQTIEVQNTDAEGRIILADANTYAERFNPALVVNVATLTGAASVALGERASAIMTKDQKLSDLLCRLGEKSGDYVWPLPFWDEYEEEIKGTIGDICNIRNRPSTRDGGTILGGMFIYQFGKKFPLWAHIDIAPRMTAVYDEYLAGGASGTPVRLLVKLLENF